VIIRERFAAPAPREQVWAYFLDVPRSSACMPGVEAVEQVGERAYRGRVQVKVGPLRAGFAMNVAIDETAPPERIVLSARGADRAGSMVQATVTATLAEATAESTSVDYEMDLAIRGPLGRFGQTVIQDTARKMSQQFVACLERSLAAEDKDEAQRA
jgi:carbon monoxide dehydrogenase subunit G